MESLKISVDLKRRTNEVLSLQQGYTYPVELSIFDNGIAYTCTGATAQVHFLKSTGKFSIKTTDITISGNKVSFKLDNTLINRGGVGQLQVVLTKDGDVFGSWAIHCNVFANVIQDESTEDSNIIDVLGDLTKNIAKADPLAKTLEKQIPQATPLTNSLKTQIPQATELVNEMKSAIEEGGTVDKRELGEFKKGYTGKEYGNLEQRINGDIDHVQQQINDSSLLPYEGTSIKADNTYYGLTKEAIVKGRTLQNLLTPNLFSDRSLWSTLGTNLTFEEGYLVGEGRSVFQNFYISDKGVILKPSTTYTIILDIKENTLSSNTANTVVGYFCEASSDSAVKQTSRTYIHVGNTGIFKIVIQTKDTFDGASVLLKSFITNNTSSGRIKLRFSIFEGDHTNTPIEELPFIEGIESTGDKSKNLFKGKLQQGRWSIAAGDFVSDDSAACTIDKIKVEPNTKYAFSSDYVLYNITYLNGDTFIESETDLVNGVFVTPSDCNYIRVSLKNAPISAKMQIEKGTVATPIEPYYDGYKIEILSHGKNLYNIHNDIALTYGISKIEEGTITTNALVNYGTFGLVNSLHNVNSRIFDKPTKIVKGKKYSISCKVRKVSGEGNLNYFAILGFKKHENSYMNTGISHSNLSNINLSKDWLELKYSNVATDNFDTACPCFQVSSNVNNLILEVKDIQIEEADASTLYEPYQEDKTQILLNEPLRQLPNGVADSIDLETGVLTRRVREVVLDGAENWRIQSTNANENGLVNFSLNNDFKRREGQKDTMCDRFPIGGMIANERRESYLFGEQTLYIRKFISSNITTVSAFKQWLQTNPTTVLYELAEPTTEQLEPTQLKSFEGTTHIVSNNTLQAHISVKIPSNVQMVVQNLRAENKALNVELKDAKEELINTDLDILEMNWETDFRVCELEYAIYGQVAKTTESENNIRAISKYEQAKTLILADRYNKATMTKQLEVYFDRGYISEKEYQELIELMN